MELFSILVSAGILMIIFEVLTPSEFFILSIGAAFILVGFFISYIPDNSTLLIALSSLSFFIFIVMKFISARYFKTQIYDSNKDQYFGMEVKIRRVVSDNRYEVKVYSEIWMGTSDTELMVGDVAFVTGMNGNTLSLKKK